jgi:hypothetical protein
MKDNIRMDPTEIVRGIAVDGIGSVLNFLLLLPQCNKYNPY